MRRLPARLLLLAGGLVMGLLLAEAGVRLLAPEAPAARVVGLNRGMFTTPGDHRVRSGEVDTVVHVNAAGFVDAEWGPRRPGVPRVVIVGDSFVQAAQVSLDQGYGRVLARLLTEAAGHEVEVLSLGVPGAGTTTALLLARQEVPALDPDLLVYGFTTSNDVLNNDPALDPKPDKPFFVLRGGALVPLDPKDARVPPWAQGRLWSHSHLVRAVGRQAARRAAVADNLARGEGLPAELRVHDPAGGEAWERAWSLTDALVEALADQAASLHAGFATVLVPDQVECTRSGRAAAAARWPTLATWDTTAAMRRARALASAHGPVVDLCPALAAAEEPDDPLYLAEDGHWTARGHAIAARASVASLLPLLPSERP
ncbi:SGNH/GDSL hydrolase family protein [Myxococcota bacterium]|nr:SGNH/GDSL hydrolase family protein [Myxococcota bacterium]